MLDSVGTIDVGKKADIVLLNADPRLSIDNLKDRSGVIFKGRYHTAEDLIRSLKANQQAAANFAEQMPQNIERNEKH